MSNVMPLAKLEVVPSSAAIAMPHSASLMHCEAQAGRVMCNTPGAGIVAVHMGRSHSSWALAAAAKHTKTSASSGTPRSRQSRPGKHGAPGARAASGLCGRCPLRVRSNERCSKQCFVAPAVRKRTACAVASLHGRHRPAARAGERFGSDWFARKAVVAQPPHNVAHGVNFKSRRPAQPCAAWLHRNEYSARQRGA